MSEYKVTKSLRDIRVVRQSVVDTLKSEKAIMEQKLVKAEGIVTTEMNYFRELGLDSLGEVKNYLDWNLSTRALDQRIIRELETWIKEVEEFTALVENQEDKINELREIIKTLRKMNRGPDYVPPIFEKEEADSFAQRPISDDEIEDEISDDAERGKEQEPKPQQKASQDTKVNEKYASIEKSIKEKEEPVPWPDQELIKGFKIGNSSGKILENKKEAKESKEDTKEISGKEDSKGEFEVSKEDIQNYGSYILKTSRQVLKIALIVYAKEGTTKEIEKKLGLPKGSAYVAINSKPSYFEVVSKKDGANCFIASEEGRLAVRKKIVEGKKLKDKISV